MALRLPNQVYGSASASVLRLVHRMHFMIVTHIGMIGFVSELGSLLTFDPAPSGPTTILARVGVSFISAAQACTNAEEEIPNFDFEDTRTASRKAWNDILGRIQVDDKDVDRETVSLLYSSVRISPVVYAVRSSSDWLFA
jgi:putative alpha-1,2-mannosidase